MNRSVGRLLVSITLIGFGCAQPPATGIYYASGKGSVTPEGLHLIDWAPFRASYVKPGTDFRRYDKVLIRELTVSYKTPPSRRPNTLSNRRPVAANYPLPDSAIQVMKRAFREAFENSLSKGESFAITQEPGPGVLLLAAGIVDLEVATPPARYQSASEPYLTNLLGKLTLLVDAKDSQSGEPLLKIGERRDLDFNDGGIYLSDSVSSSGALQQIFRDWADRLRREIEQFRALPALPPAPGS